MRNSRTLAGFILLLKSDVSPQQAKQAADAVLARLEPLYEPPSREKARIPDAAIRQRILESLNAFPHMPSTHELLPRVKGNRGRVYKLVRTMISEGVLELVRDGRHTGLKSKAPVK